MTATFLVTGGSGFIGTWVLKDLLSRGHNVVVYDIADGGERWERLLGPEREKIAFVPGDILDSAKLNHILDEWNVTHVIHLAAWLTPQCQQDPIRGCEINVLGTQRIFEFVKSRPGRIKGLSYASSVAVYGREMDDVLPDQPHRNGVSSNGAALNGAHAQDEDALEPETFYGAFKRANELVAKQYWLHHGIPSVGLRPYVIYGPGREHGSTAASTLATRAVASGESFMFPYSGRSGYEFVADTARAFVRSALEVNNGCYAVDLPGVTADVSEIMTILDRLSPGAAELLSSEGDPLPYPVSPHQFILSELFPDWQTTSLENGLRQTFEYYRDKTRGQVVGSQS
jgi:nucleoside-diphosphate-sugar epimerase